VDISNQIIGRLFAKSLFGFLRLFGNWLLKRVFPLKLDRVQCKIEGMARLVIRQGHMSTFAAQIEIDNRTDYDLVPVRCTIDASVSGRSLALYDLAPFEEWRAREKYSFELKRPVDSALAQNISDGSSSRTQSLHMKIEWAFLTQLGLRKLESHVSGNIDIQGP
jgi:hypothetical protein